MNNVSKFILILFVALTANVVAQSTSEKLRKEQQQLEKNISNTKQLLDKAKSNTASSLNELKLLNNQIAYREQLVQNFDNQIRGAELKIKEKQNQIEELSEEMKTLREQYKKLLLYAYKNRNKYGKMMYVFSSDSYYEAVKRTKYLEKIQDLIKKQFLVMEQHQKLIAEEMRNIDKEKQHKTKMLDEKKKEREQIVSDKKKQEEVYQQLKTQESEIASKLKDDERKRAAIKKEIDAAIRKEIEDASFNEFITAADKHYNNKNYQKAIDAYKNALAIKPQNKHAKTRLSDATAKLKDSKSSTTTTTKPDTKPAETTSPRPTPEIQNTAEVAALNKSFEGNRGKLPWPVEKGSLTERYGENKHPTAPGVITYNNGIDISAPKNAQVRAVFEGEVTSVLVFPGVGKAVIIKHGNYRTVYSYLQNVFVNVGDKVSTKQVIGSLVSPEGQSLSTAHFEVRQIVGGNLTTLNPSLWLAK